MYISGAIKQMQFLGFLVRVDTPKQVDIFLVDTSVWVQQMSKAALEAYRQTGSGTTHDRVREWSDSLGTDQ